MDWQKPLRSKNLFYEIWSVKVIAVTVTLIKELLTELGIVYRIEDLVNARASRTEVTDKNVSFLLRNYRGVRMCRRGSLVLISPIKIWSRYTILYYLLPSSLNDEQILSFLNSISLIN
jgi:hypothetical protein